MNEEDRPLSAAGEARRDHIGRLARRAAGRRRGRRLAGRGVLGLAAVVALVPLFWPRRGPPFAVVPRRATAPVVPAAEPSCVITFVGTDPTITARLSARPGPPGWVVIDDRQLLDALASAGRPAGLVARDGRSVVLYRDGPVR